MPRHQCAAEMMALFADLVLEAATSQHAAAAVLRIVARYVPGRERIPCANSGRLWLLRLTLTPLAFLLPPGWKNKARYMNLDTLVEWGKRALADLDEPGDFPGQEVDRKKLQQKLGWLDEYRRPLADWGELLEVAERAGAYIRREGYHAGAAAELAAELFPVARTPASLRLKAGVLRFVAAQAKGLPEGQRLLGTSEVWESLLGKYKRIQGTHSKGGMTGSLLNSGAAVRGKTARTVQAAMAAVPVAAVGRWVREKLGLTIPAHQAILLQRNKKCPTTPTLLQPEF